MADRFRSLDENWGSFLDSPFKQIREGHLSNDPAVIAVAHAVEMLGLRLQYLQSTMKALAGGQIVDNHDFLKSRPGNRPEKSDRGLKKLIEQVTLESTNYFPGEGQDVNTRITKGEQNCLKWQTNKSCNL